MTDGRRSLHGWAVAATLLLLGVALAACGSDGSNGSGGSSGSGGRPQTRTSSVDAHGIAVDGASLRPPGTTFAGDLEVQEGTQLVQQVFPLIQAGAGGDGAVVGWQAVLAVTGDPVDVWNRYARAVGLADRASATKSCVVRSYEPADRSPPSTTVPTETSVLTVQNQDWGPPTRFLTEPELDGENQLRCDATIERVTMSMAVGAPTCHSVAEAGNDGCWARPTSHLFLQVLDPSQTPPAQDRDQLGTDEPRYERSQHDAITSGQPSDDDRPWAPIPPGPVLKPNLPDAAPIALPGPGDPFDDGIDGFLGQGTAEVDQVPPKGRSLIAPALLVACNSGLVSVLHTPSAPRASVAWFDDRDDADDPMRITDGSFRGRNWSSGLISTAGGYYLDVTAVAAAGGGSTVLLTECGD